MPDISHPDTLSALLELALDVTMHGQRGPDGKLTDAAQHRLAQIHHWTEHPEHLAHVMGWDGAATENPQSGATVAPAPTEQAEGGIDSLRYEDDPPAPKEEKPPAVKPPSVKAPVPSTVTPVTVETPPPAPKPAPSLAPNPAAAHKEYDQLQTDLTAGHWHLGRGAASHAAKRILNLHGEGPGKLLKELGVSLPHTGWQDSESLLARHLESKHGTRKDKHGDLLVQGPVQTALQHGEGLPEDMNGLAPVKSPYLKPHPTHDMVQDTAGQTYRLERGTSPAQLRDSALTDRLASVLGADVPAFRLFETPQGPRKLVSGAQGVSPETSFREQNFVADALLGRLDGGLRFHADGTPRELSGMVDLSGAPPDVKRQAQAVMAKGSELLTAAPPALRKILRERLDDLARQFNGEVGSEQSGSGGTGAGATEPGDRMAGAPEGPNPARTDPEGSGSSRSAGGEPAGSVPASLEDADRRVSNFIHFFRAKGKRNVSGWLGRLRDHINEVGVEAALDNLGPEVQGEGEPIQYAGAKLGDFAKQYLDRYGIKLVKGHVPKGDERVISTLASSSDRRGVRARGREDDVFPSLPTLHDKLQESQHIPGLERSDDLSKLMGGEFGAEVKQFTPDILKKLDEIYGQGQWIVKPYSDEGFAGYGIFFPQRVKQLQRDAKDAIRAATLGLKNTGLEPIRKDGVIVGVADADGNQHLFGTEEYDKAVKGSARRFADVIANAASSESGTALPPGRFMAQPAYRAVGISDAERAQGVTFKKGQEGRVHITTHGGKVQVIPHATLLKDEVLPVVFENDDTRAMAKAAEAAINALPESGRQGQVYAPDVMRTQDGFKVVELNWANEAGASWWLQGDPMIIDAYVSHLTGREPAHVQFIRRLLSKKQSGEDREGRTQHARIDYADDAPDLAPAKPPAPKAPPKPPSPPKAPAPSKVVAPKPVAVAKPAGVSAAPAITHEQLAEHLSQLHSHEITPEHVHGVAHALLNLPHEHVVGLREEFGIPQEPEQATPPVQEPPSQEAEPSAFDRLRLVAGQGEGKPEPRTPRDDTSAVEAFAKSEAPHDQDLRGKIDAGLQTATLPEGQAEQYRQTAHAVLGGMSTNARQIVAQNLKDVSFHGDTQAVKQALVEHLLANRSYKGFDEIRRSQNMVAGAYVSGAGNTAGTVFADGDDPKAHPFEWVNTPKKVYAHEFTHALDGPGVTFSGHKDWQYAAAAEILYERDGAAPLSQYALHSVMRKPDQNYAEAFAEFGRLVLTGSASPMAIEQRFPLCAAFWKRHGLLPGQEGTEEGERPGTRIGGVRLAGDPGFRMPSPKVVRDYQENGTKAKAFKNWFGDYETNPRAASKIVDGDGEPLRVYHGTAKAFDEFASGKVGTGKGKGLPDTETEAYFFTADPEMASDYASKMTFTNPGANGYPKGANVVPAYLSIKDPLPDYSGDRGHDIDYVSKMIERAKRLGHDGLILRQGDPGNWVKGKNGLLPNGRQGYQVFIAFSPNQIKSVNNLGSFDPASPRINLAAAGEPRHDWLERHLGDH